MILWHPVYSIPGSVFLYSTRLYRYKRSLEKRLYSKNVVWTTFSSKIFPFFSLQIVLKYSLFITYWLYNPSITIINGAKRQKIDVFDKFKVKTALKTTNLAESARSAENF